MSKYLTSSIFAASSLFAAMAPASAAPNSLNLGLASGQPGYVQTVRSDCSWVNGGWFYRNGAQRFVVCRPDRPGRDYSWRREGRQFGWYHPQRREWHNRNW